MILGRRAESKNLLHPSGIYSATPSGASVLAPRGRYLALPFRAKNLENIME